MVVVGRVALALSPAFTTNDDARFECRADDAEVHFGLAGHDAADRVADIGAVQTAPDAPDELRHLRLAEAGVGAGGARRGTIEALVDTPQEQVAINARRPRMPLDDLPNRHVALLHFWGVIPGAAVVQAHTSMLSRKAAPSSAISSAWLAVANWPVSRRRIEERWSAHLDDPRPTAADRR